MLVSVIMPLYNVENYVHEAINSFLQQTMTDFEIICVDDGSTDSTPQIIEAYAAEDSRIKLIRQKNLGAGAARNNGMKYATGKYIYFFDGDDYCKPDLLERLVIKANRTGADIVVLDYYRIDDCTKKEQLYKGLDSKFLPQDKETFCYTDVPNNILSIINPTPWNKFYNREFVLSTSLSFMELSTTNDITFCALSAAMATKIAYVNQPLMYYRINRTDSITSKKTKNLVNVLLAVKAVVDQGMALPYASQIENSIRKFAVENLIFALEHYAGKFLSTTYKDYYQKLHSIFNEEFYTNINADIIPNQTTFAKFKKIHDCSYHKVFAEKLLEKFYTAIKTVRWPSAKSFSEQANRLLQRYSSESRSLKTQIRELKKSEDLLVRRTRSMQKEMDVLKNHLRTIEAMLSTRSYGLNQPEREQRIIVSMTSFPERIQFVPLTLERLMNQTVKPDKIILWLAKEQFLNLENDLPSRLLEMKSRGLEIKWCEDLKAYKKLLPALKQFPNDLIITVDDDLLYDVDLVENLYEAHRMYPQAIIASRVHKVTYNADGTVAPYQEWEKEIDYDTYEPKHDLFVTGGAGTLYPPPHIFSPEVFNIDVIQSLCPFADDIWINMMAAIYDTPIVYTGKNRRLRYIEGTQENRLYDVNVTANDIQLHDLAAYYGNRQQIYII